MLLQIDKIDKTLPTFNFLDYRNAARKGNKITYLKQL